MTGLTQPERRSTGKWESNPGAGIMESDDRQVKTVFTAQPSFHHRHSTKTEYHEALPSSANDEVMCDCTFADDGNAS